MLKKIVLLIGVVLLPSITNAEQLKFTESEFLANMFRYFGVVLNGNGSWNKEYYAIADNYNWPIVENDMKTAVTIGKASSVIMSSQGLKLSEDEALTNLINNGYIPNKANSSDYVYPNEMNMLAKYINENKPIKIIKPVITPSEAAQAVLSYKEKKYKVRKDLEYYPFCDYLYYGRDIYSYYTKDTQATKLDVNGIPMAVYANGTYYNPVIIAQYALALYGRILMGENLYAKFYAACDKLVSMQDVQGAFRFPFDFRLTREGKVLSAGWVSGMAQGQALSVLSRAYRLSKDVKYLKSGNVALYYMTLPDTGIKTTLGDLSPELNNYIFLVEYPSTPNTYTLNGFMFTILGLYDWWQLSPEEAYGNHATAKMLFNEGIKTLKYALPYYDAGGYSMYDLSHITYKIAPLVDIGYHKIHIELLIALYSITNDQLLNYYKNLWISYVEP